MAHNVYQNTMAFTGATPWHKLGVQFDEPMTAAQAIEAARLGYNVSKHALYLPAPGEAPSGYRQAPGAWATVNDDTQDVLGIVGDDYTPLQNREAFEFFDVLLGEAGARYETAGALGKGERVWLLARMPQTFEPLLGDKIGSYCLLSNGHDGRHQVTVRFTQIRVVCQNTLTTALANSPATVTLRHTTNVKANLRDAASLLEQYNAHCALLQETFQRLAELRIDEQWLQDYQESLFPAPAECAAKATVTRYEARMESFTKRLYFGMGTELPGVLGSAWGAYNAAVEWADYEYPTRGDAPRTNSILFGAANDFKQLAFTAATTMVRA